MLEAPPGHLILQTLRSHDRWNTVPYSANDRYRGIHQSCREADLSPGPAETIRKPSLDNRAARDSE